MRTGDNDPDALLRLSLETCEDFFAHTTSTVHQEIDTVLNGHGIAAGRGWLIDMLALTRLRLQGRGVETPLRTAQPSAVGPVTVIGMEPQRRALPESDLETIFGIVVTVHGHLLRRCVRVAEGGEVFQTVALDRGGFAGALGGPDRATLFVTAAKWQGMTESDMVTPGSGQVLTIQVEVPGAGWP